MAPGHDEPRPAPGAVRRLRSTLAPYVRPVRTAWGHAARHVRFRAAALYRPTLLRRVTVVGITGSAGKTMAKELLAAILSTTGPGQWTVRGLNEPWNVARTILRTRPWHRFCVLEIAGNMKPLEPTLAMARPHVAVVTTVGADHISAFDSVDAIAAEKSKLVAQLPPGGIAILNADDARVLAMRDRCPGRRVFTYGAAPDACVRADDVQGRWPDRLSFTLHHAGRTARVETQLCGSHWMPSVLAAVTTALALGVPLDTAVAAVRTVAPYPGRMAPVTTPDGITFVADTIKAPYWSLPLTLEFLRQARAPRKVFVLGTISDYRGASGPKYVGVARQALEAADHVLVVGARAATCMKARRHPADDALHGVATPEAARAHLERLLRPGDLVVLKGSRVDRLDTLLDLRSAPPATRRLAAATPRAIQVVVGLGNPDETRRDTPHNVGRRAVEALAAALGAAWTPEDDAMVASVEHAGGTCVLVTTRTPINETGVVVRRLADRLGFGAAECILLHDDIDLPVGAVRVRMHGGDGGHRGVRSVLEALQSPAARRVKIGVGRPTAPAAAASHVLGRFAAAELPLIDKACAEAAARAQDLAGIARPAPVT